MSRRLKQPWTPPRTADEQILLTLFSGISEEQLQLVLRYELRDQPLDDCIAFLRTKWDCDPEALSALQDEGLCSPLATVSAESLDRLTTTFPELDPEVLKDLCSCFGSVEETLDYVSRNRSILTLKREEQEDPHLTMEIPLDLPELPGQHIANAKGNPFRTEEELSSEEEIQGLPELVIAKSPS